MGKGNRAKAQAAQNNLNNTGVGKNAAAKKSPVVIAVSIVLAVVLLVSLVYGVFSKTGIAVRLRKDAETKNFKLNGAMMTYFFNTQYSSFASSYYETYASAFGYKSIRDIASAKNYSSIKQMKHGDGSYIDTLMSQTYSEDVIKSKSYYDYFMDKTTEYVTELLLYCQVAHDNGVKLDSKDKAMIKLNLDSIKEEWKKNNNDIKNYNDELISRQEDGDILAKQQGTAPVLTYKQFVENKFGQYVTIDDVKKCIELETLAAKYAEQYATELADRLTATEIDNYMHSDEHYKEFVTANYTSFTLSALRSDAEGDSEDQWNTYKASIKEYADKIAKAKTIEEFKDAVADYLWDKTNTFDYLKNTAGSDTEKDAMRETKKEEILKKVDEKIANNKEYKATGDGTSELDKFLFGTKIEEIKKVTEGDRTLIVTPDEKETELTTTTTAETTTTEGEETATDTTDTTEETSTTVEVNSTSEEESSSAEEGTTAAKADNKTKVQEYIVYFLNEDVSIPSYSTCDITFITVNTKAAAEELLNRFNNTGKTADDLYNVGRDYYLETSLSEMKKANKDSEYKKLTVNYNKAQNVIVGKDDAKPFSVDKFDEWLKSQDRKAGDFSGIIENIAADDKTESSYALIFYKGTGKSSDKATAISKIVEEKLNEFIEDNANKYVTFSKDYFYKLDV